MTEIGGNEFKTDLTRFMEAKFKSAQEKANALAGLAKKYNMPVEKLLTNIVKEWLNEDKEKRHSAR